MPLGQISIRLYTRAGSTIRSSSAKKVMQGILGLGSFDNLNVSFNQDGVVEHMFKILVLKYEK